MAGTIQQIADMAGVSRGTVDRVLNHRGRVRPEVAEHIEQIAEEIGYETKQQRNGRLREIPGYDLTIGVITHLCRSSFMLNIRRGIEEISAKLEKQGIHVLLREVDGVDGQAQALLLDELTEIGVDGLAIMPVDSEDVRSRMRFLAVDKKIPVVTFNTDIYGTGRMCFVGLDNRKSGETAAGLMAMMMRERGEVVGIIGSFSNSTGIQRIDGFSEVLKAQYPEMKLIGVQSSSDSAVEVERIVDQVMTAYPDLGGIFLVSGGQAGLKRAFEKREMGRHPYAVIYDLTENNRVYLRDDVVDFLIDQDGFTQGYRAVSLVADKLRWNKDPERENMYTEINIMTKFNV
ncbi:MAG: LacI family DNA-binding transcriptional regulator [Clostridiales bacterium]|nr:LacI family DNA-binding transcriptional regulator [Clostridiales bacterium]